MNGSFYIHLSRTSFYTVHMIQENVILSLFVEQQFFVFLCLADPRYQIFNEVSKIKSFTGWAIANKLTHPRICTKLMKINVHEHWWNHKIKEPSVDPYLCDSTMDVSSVYDFRKEVTFHRVPHKLPRLAGFPGRMSHKPQVVRVTPPGVYLVTERYCHLSIKLYGI